MKKQTSWQLIYKEYSGLEKHAVEFLSREFGKYIIREDSEYILHVLPCIKEKADLVIEENAVILGVLGESELLGKYLTAEDTSDCDYLVKAIENPNNPEATIFLVAAKEEKNIYLAAAAFVDDYLMRFCWRRGCLEIVKKFFDDPITKGILKYTVKSETRSIFAWGHAINDYRAFIRDMARQGLNQLILWNDYAPINAKDVVDFAHSFGIEMIWGFAWGWHPGSGRGDDLSDESLAKIRNSVVENYKNNWHGVGDGIYFQSFTEHESEYIGGRLVAEAVTDLVNSTANELYKIEPNLKIQFGLHATSVKKHPAEIAKVDTRIEIVWEDCGAFPYSYYPVTDSEERVKETLEFTKEIINLRGKEGKTGLVFRGFSTLDWTNKHFVHQKGPYVLGENAEEILEHDRLLREETWRKLSAEWIRHGEQARMMAEFIINETGGRVNLCLAGAFDGGLWFPSAVCSEVVLNPYRDFGEILEKVAWQKHVIFN